MKDELESFPWVESNVTREKDKGALRQSKMGLLRFDEDQKVGQIVSIGFGGEDVQNFDWIVELTLLARVRPFREKSSGYERASTARNRDRLGNRNDENVDFSSFSQITQNPQMHEGVRFVVITGCDFNDESEEVSCRRFPLAAVKLNRLTDLDGT